MLRLLWGSSHCRTAAALVLLSFAVLSVEGSFVAGPTPLCRRQRRSSHHQARARSDSSRSPTTSTATTTKDIYQQQQQPASSSVVRARGSRMMRMRDCCWRRMFWS